MLGGLEGGTNLCILLVQCVTACVKWMLIVLCNTCVLPALPLRAERAAKQAKVGMWHNYVAPTSNTAKLRCV